MSLFSYLKKQKQKDNIVVIFDIGSASVGSALINLRENMKPKILYTTRKQMVLEENLDTKNFENSMFRTLKSVISDVEKNGLIHLNFLKMKNKEIKRAFCFLSSPWYTSQTKIIEFEKDKAFNVTEDLINSIIQKEEENFLNSDSYNDQNIFNNKKTELIDKKIVQIKLNGYIVDNPYKKKVKNIETSLFMSVSPEDITKKIRNTISKTFNVDNIKIHSLALASFSSIRDIFKKEDNFIFIDISGELTDVSFVKDGVLRETQSFPIGKNTFFRDVMKEFKITQKATSSMFNLYNKETLEKESIKKFEVAISNTKKDWIKFLENGMLILSKNSLLPKNIFFTAGDDIGMILKDVVKETKFTKLIFPDYNNIFNPILINSKNIEDSLLFSNKIEKDIFLWTEAVFVSKIIKR